MRPTASVTTSRRIALQHLTTDPATLHNTPSGDTDIVSFELMGYEFQAISAGPLFRFNPAISFMVNFDPSQDAKARDRTDEVCGKLLEGGRA